MKQPADVLYRRTVLKDFAIFTGTPVLGSLFNKVAGMKPCIFIKKRLQLIYFSVNITNLFKTAILKNISELLLLS